MIFFERLGDVGQYALPLGVGLHALYRGHIKEAMALGLSAAVQQVALFTLKYLIVAPRPFPYGNRLDSFPSGHTAGAFLAIGFVFALDRCHIQRSSTTYKVCLIALAFFVGLSRILSQNHWPVDVAAGAFLGLFFGVAGVKTVSFFE